MKDPYKIENTKEMNTEKIIKRMEKMVNFLTRFKGNNFDTTIKQLENDINILYIKLIEEKLG
jgi:hypothetical protein